MTDCMFCGLPCAEPSLAPAKLCAACAKRRKALQTYLVLGQLAAQWYPGGPFVGALFSAMDILWYDELSEEDRGVLNEATGG